LCAGETPGRGLHQGAAERIGLRSLRRSERIYSSSGNGRWLHVHRRPPRRSSQHEEGRGHRVPDHLKHVKPWGTGSARVLSCLLAMTRRSPWPILVLLLGLSPSVAFVVTPAGPDPARVPL